MCTVECVQQTTVTTTKDVTQLPGSPPLIFYVEMVYHLPYIEPGGYFHILIIINFIFRNARAFSRRNLKGLGNEPLRDKTWLS